MAFSLLCHVLLKPGWSPSGVLVNMLNCGIVVSKLLATIVEGDPKAPFSIAITPRYRGRCYSFHWIAPLYPWSIPYNSVLSKEASGTIFESDMTRPEVEFRSSRPLVNTLTIIPMSDVKLYHNFSFTKMAWALNNIRRLICH